MCRVIFLGPSLDLESARSILADAIYLPPLRQADLLTALDRYRPSAIGIIDGYFLQDLSVWHKEILLALRRGVAVYGASSMGALRAAEMAPYGMCGIGWIYQAFATGSLTDDDEVALAHSPAELGYARLSEPMVNVRATLEAAVDRAAISVAERDAAVAAAKAIYFTERNLPRLADAWREAGMDGETVARLEESLRSYYVDIKRLDAIALLQAMAADQPRIPEMRQDLPEPRSISFDTLYHRDRRARSGETEVEMSGIYRHAAIHEPSFESVRYQALNRKLVALLAANLGLVASAEEIEDEARRFRARQSITREEPFRDWLRQNDLTGEEFLALMAEVATCRRVHQWWLAAAGGYGQRVRVVLDELKLTGRYRPAAQAAAELKHATADLPMPETHAWTRAEIAALVRQHAVETGFRLDKPIQSWAGETGYFAFEDLLGDLYRSRAGRQMRTAGQISEKEAV